jgi:hypothetical protein
MGRAVGCCRALQGGSRVDSFGPEPRRIAVLREQLLASRQDEERLQALLAEQEEQESTLRASLDRRMQRHAALQLTLHDLQSTLAASMTAWEEEHAFIATAFGHDHATPQILPQEVAHARLAMQVDAENRMVETFVHLQHCMVGVACAVASIPTAAPLPEPLLQQQQQKRLLLQNNALPFAASLPAPAADSLPAATGTLLSHASVDA